MPKIIAIDHGKSTFAPSKPEKAPPFQNGFDVLGGLEVFM